MAEDILLRNPGAPEGVVVTRDGSVLTFKKMSDGTTLLPTVDVLVTEAGAAVNDLTEDNGVIGGTNDGDLPDLTSPDAAGNAAAIRELATTVNALLASLRAAGLIEAGD